MKFVILLLHQHRDYNIYDIQRVCNVNYKSCIKNEQKNFFVNARVMAFIQMNVKKDGKKFQTRNVLVDNCGLEELLQKPKGCFKNLSKVISGNQLGIMVFFLFTDDR